VALVEALAKMVGIGRRAWPDFKLRRPTVVGVARYLVQDVRERAEGRETCTGLRGSQSTLVQGDHASRDLQEDPFCTLQCI